MKRILTFFAALFILNAVILNAENGTEADPFLINDKADLIALGQGINNGNSFQYHGSLVNRNAYNQYFKLTSDIVYNDMEFDEDGGYSGNVAPEAWSPIGFFNYDEWDFYSFQGFFDGDGNTIYGLYCDDPGKEYVGFFGVLQGGKVNDLHVSKSYFCGKDYVGGIAGDAEGLIDYETGIFDNARITNCIFDGTVKGETQTGGIAGLMYWADAIGCVNIGKVIGGQSCGGIAGFFRDVTSSVKYCLNAGEVVGDDYCGGITGLLDQALVESCVNIGWVVERNPSDTTHYGAISGGNALQMGAVRYCYYDKQMCPLLYGVATDSLPGDMGVFTRNLISGGFLGDYNWVETPDSYPVPAGMHDSFGDVLAVASAPVSLMAISYAYDKVSDVQNDFSVSLQNGVSWSELNGNLTINGSNVTFNAIEEYAVLKVTKNNASRKISLFLNRDGLDVAENTDIQYNIYPNPARDIIVAEGVGLETVSLFDITGHLMMTKASCNDKVTLDISGLAGGVYFLKTNTEGKVFKIIKQ